MRARERGLWPLRLETRAQPSSTMRVIAAPLAVLLLLATVYAVLAVLGRHPNLIFRIFFFEPVNSVYGAGELLLKATPLMLCALGLAPGFRANVWNIGAEGQLTLGRDHQCRNRSLLECDPRSVDAAADGGGRYPRWNGLGSDSRAPCARDSARARSW